MKPTIVLALLASGALLAACGTAAEESAPVPGPVAEAESAESVPDESGRPEATETGSDPQAADDAEEVVVSAATVRSVEGEAGCWAIEDADGNRYEPLELPREHRNDGAMVSAVLRPRPDTAGPCGTGSVVEVISIETARFDPGRVRR